MLTKQIWLPPGKNCGLCGQDSCKSFLRMVTSSLKEFADCPYYDERQNSGKAAPVLEAAYPDQDILGHRFDFVLAPLPGEISARKIVLPFRSDLVEKNGYPKRRLCPGTTHGSRMSHPPCPTGH